ncbi:MAG: aminotransferase class I/II-fold pyridoxal phosphate-dependent enzyme [Dehalococcoidia bacterium]|nr:aminotransferase class I/II-fold pyridoxal phosphate-dependent enzyme [Dehalococcoidia bacterium]
MRFSERMNRVPPYLFVQISRKIAEKKAQGIEVISFGIGDPDIPTPDYVIDALGEASHDAPNHRYPESEGLPEFREGVADWYQRRFGVKLDSEKEVVSLIGAKEGIGHVAFCFLDAGDIALVPDPGYPVYAMGTLFAGGESYMLPLNEENDWLPDLDSIPGDVASKAKLLWLNYPNNPTGAVADLEYYRKAIQFAENHDIAVMHDACYTEVAYDGYRPPSFLQAEGAMDVGIEFHSLSKSYNMTGWRIGMAVGNADMIDALLTIKSNLDSGVPQAVQHMAIEAMKRPLESVDERNAVYQARRDRIVPVLKDMGMKVESPKAGLYIWAGVPGGYTSAEFAEKLLEDTDVLMIPGGNYGAAGEGYVRLSITLQDELIDKALDRVSDWRP